MSEGKKRPVENVSRNLNSIEAQKYWAALMRFDNFRVPKLPIPGNQKPLEWTEYCNFANSIVTDYLNKLNDPLLQRQHYPKKDRKKPKS